jgi:choline dehydrogenase-like flavoprotein
MQTDTLIIGCGIAGATAALQLAADSQRRVVLLTRAEDSIDLNSNMPRVGSSDAA